MSNMMKPAHDQVQIRVNMNSDEMDSFVFCLAGKKVWVFKIIGFGYNRIALRQLKVYNIDLNF